MKRWNLLDRREIDVIGTVDLFEHDGDYEIRINHQVLMSTRAYHSEQELAAVGCAGLSDAPSHILIGGLGFGFTLIEVLKLTHSQTQVTVAELLPCVVEWNKDEKIGPAHKHLQDKRVHLVLSDVHDCLRKEPNQFDAILLDTDNGPEAFTKQSNQRLYSENGLRTIWRALRNNGTFAVWSSHSDPAFLKRIEKAGFESDCLQTRARHNKGSQHFVYSGKKKVHSKDTERKNGKTRRAY